MAVPVYVSPLIKLCRWSLLAAGIVYGFDKHRKYKVEEAIFQKKNEKFRREKEAYLAQERERLNAATIAEIEGYLFGKPLAEQSPAADSDTSEDMSSDTSSDTLKDANKNAVDDAINDTSDDTTDMLNDTDSDMSEEANDMLNDTDSDKSKEANDMLNDTDSDMSKEANDMLEDTDSDMSKEANDMLNDTDSDMSKEANVRTWKETNVESSKETNVEPSKEPCIVSPNETEKTDKTNIITPITEDIPLDKNEATDELEVEEAEGDWGKEIKKSA